jgi:hypothetical protein
MSSTTTIASYELACSRDHREVPDGYNFAAHAFGCSCITMSGVGGQRQPGLM